MAEERWLKFGRIGRAQGLRGEMRFTLYNPSTEHLPLIERVRLQFGTAPPVEFDVRRIRPQGSRTIISLDGVADRTAAEQWTNAEVEIQASVFAALEDEDEFYSWQLEGMDAVDAAGSRVGEVRGLVDYGAGDILVLRVRGRELMIPFARPWVVEVDETERHIIVEISEFEDA